ncbi:MAG TPA: pectinesterase family protein [Bryobacteraceae bacterium]|nr:pectinesterase family protein [Bryobacteraceae bacterium]
MKKLIPLLFLLPVISPGAVKIVLVGDSTVNDQGGWGKGFSGSFDTQVQVVNLALNGRSSRSFRDEGHWEPVLNEKPDYVLIQFGHNDSPGKGPERETDPNTTYRANLIRYIDEARAAGAKPVLVTSIVRRNFDETGKIKADSLVPYVEATRAVAREKNVPLMDLYNLTRAEAEKRGPDGCLEIDAVGADGKPDTTHLGPIGRNEIGAIAAKEFVRVVPAMRPMLAGTPPPMQVVVAADGSGDFKTIQMAIDHAPFVPAGQRLNIEIRPGIYKERLVVPQDRPRTTFLGEDAAKTIITAAMSAKEAGGTFLSSTVDVQGAEFHAGNITFENTFGVGSQAVALMIHSDKAEFRHCRFLGWQDTLYAASGRQYYKDCYIEGHVDYIFGNAAAVFDHCEIHSKGDGYLTAQSRTSAEMPTGFVFYHCKLTAENQTKGSYLGRPWRPYSRVVYIDCAMDGFIRPEGWNNWNSAANEKTAWYGEYGSTGPGAKTAERAAWSRQLTAEQAAAFGPDVFLRGSDGWNPAAH